MHLFDIGFIPFNLVDFLDLILFTVIFYRFYIMIKDTRAITMFVGLFSVLIFGVIAESLNFSIISWLMGSIGPIFWLAFFILFQPELRRILIEIGHNRFIRMLLKIETKTVIDEVAKAAFILSEKRFGGLLVLQRSVGIKNVIDTGVMLKSEVTAELLVTIFFPRSPLHDGAAIINNDVLVAAQCILPVSDRDNLDTKYGTRHRAALGLSEESDAVIIVVSEETGDISIVFKGEFLKIETEESLVKKVKRLFTMSIEK